MPAHTHRKGFLLFYFFFDPRATQEFMQFTNCEDIHTHWHTHTHVCTFPVKIIMPRQETARQRSRRRSRFG